MRWSRSFIPTLKEIPVGTEAVSHQLLLRAGLVNMLTSGVYSYLPLGLKVLKRVEQIIREEMEAAGAQELFLPCLQPVDLWKKTGRVEAMKDVMIRFQDKKGKDMCLGPTHEEVITDLVKDQLKSYKQLPVTLYQIQTKFRDEIRPRFGVIRACEFIMKDAYSFDRDKAGLDKNYELMYKAYENIFRRSGVETVILEADSGAMGGDLSHEFMVPAEIGEDEIPAGKGAKGTRPAIEIGHIFQLGTKYTEALDVCFLDEHGKRQPIIMGCYGIGVSRLIAAIIEKNHDKAGIIWPREVAPFPVEILPLQLDDPRIAELSERFYAEFREDGIDVLLDDRPDESPGKKFKDADLIGIPWQVVLGKRMLAEDKVEIKNRADGQTMTVKLSEVKAKLQDVLGLQE